MITYSINGMGGPLGHGVPSLDVAIAIAVDFERYRYDDEDVLKRVEVEVDLSAREHPDDPPFVLVTGEGSRGLGVCVEDRCDKCGRC